MLVIIIQALENSLGNAPRNVELLNRADKDNR